MRKRAVILICILALLAGQIAVPARAAVSSTPRSIVVYSAIILGAAEAVNLIVRGIIYLASKKPKIKVIPPKVLQTNVAPPMTNLIVSAATNTNRTVALVTMQTNTNRSSPIVVELPAPALVTPRASNISTNRTVVFSWLPVTNNPPVTYRIVTDTETNNATMTRFDKIFSVGEHSWMVQAVLEPTNRGAWSEARGFQIITNIPLFTSTATFSNLTESEKDDISMFGIDYYYLVSLAYYGVKKYDKSREFMLHSLAIGSRVEEGTKFLKETLKLKSKDIAAGVARYRNSR